MGLAIKAIRDAKSDDKLLQLLLGALTEALPPTVGQSNDEYVARMQRLPAGLHAMAATYELDVSMASDDLGWHFGNWHHEGLAKEALWGLRELEATEAAEVFESAHNLALQYWENLGSEGWQDWYVLSPLDKAMDPLNVRMWAICKRHEMGLMGYWIAYARRHPERVVSGSQHRPC
jgi:hypothetical protein